MTTTSPSKNSFIAIAILSIAILIAGYFLLGAQQTTVSLKSDTTAYFIIDKPVVSLHLQNPQKANVGEIRVSYNDAVLSLIDTNPSEGASVKELKNTLIFDLSKEYFATGNDLVSTITFEANKPGSAKLTVDESTYLNSDEGVVEIKEFNGLEISVGVPPTREHEDTDNGPDGYNSY